ncbi:MAG: D-2-hydroxyacid dehydrogenase family protein [Deltaproteobacteria bacterium]|nr:D-2-hydroxyacid dehydrogenase family protein [Deltaproteobacteria bacterium]MBW2306960.1 D-2-hydroxyacid dehydrogenase family protein [Deltaproteobacteria bacterium]
MIRIALLDDYQGAAMKSAPWDNLPDNCVLEVFRDHLKDQDAVALRIKDFEVVMALRERTPFPRSLLKKLPNLKLLATAGMRNASIDLKAATELGILVCGTSSYKSSTVELAWGLILAVTRNIPREHYGTVAGKWQQTLGVGLEGKTLGILGLGHIGGKVAEVARAFRMRIIAWSQNLKEERASECGAQRVEKEELFKQADILTIHTVLSDRTRGLISHKELRMMKPTAYLINTSRGPIVDEKALIKALRSKVIAGAGLDVFDEEPLPKNHALFGQENVILTPHLGYVTEEVYRIFYGETLENIINFLKGEPQRVLNPEVLQKLRPL